MCFIGQEKDLDDDSRSKQLMKKVCISFLEKII